MHKIKLSFIILSTCGPFLHPLRRKESISGQRRARIIVFTSVCVCVCVCVCVHMCRGYPGSPWVPEERWGLSYPIRARKAIPPMGYSQDQRVHLAVSDSVLEKGPISFYRASLDFAKNCQAFKIQPLLTHIAHWTLPVISPKAFTLAPLKHGAVPTSKLCIAVKSNPWFRTCRLQIL